MDFRNLFFSRAKTNTKGNNYREGFFYLPLAIYVYIIATCVAVALDLNMLERSFSTRFGNARLNFLKTWEQVVITANDFPTPEKLRVANDFFNQNIYFSDDWAVWGQNDYWATPLETLAKGRGDCEDFAIAKYFSLKAMGIPVSRLRLVYVKVTQMGPAGPVVQAHMVLAYYQYPGAEPLVLDNINPKIYPASQRTDLVPVYSFNSEGIWQGTGNQVANGQLSRLQDMLTRARMEGFY